MCFPVHCSSSLAVSASSKIYVKAPASSPLPRIALPLLGRRTRNTVRPVLTSRTDRPTLIRRPLRSPRLLLNARLLPFASHTTAGLQCTTVPPPAHPRVCPLPLVTPAMATPLVASAPHAWPSASSSRTAGIRC